MKIKIIATALFLALLSGCGEDDKQAELTRTVDWYKEYKAERSAKLEECKNNPGELSATPNCINAQKAASSLTWSKRGRPKLVPLKADQTVNKRK